MEFLKLYSKEKIIFLLNQVAKRGNTRKGCVKIENWGTSVYFVLRFQENSMQNLSCFLVIKGILRGKDIH